MTFTRWLLKQMSNKNNLTVFILSVMIKVMNLKVGSPFFSALLNWSIYRFRRNYVLPFHIPCVVYANFLHKWQHLPFKVDSEQQTLLVKLYTAILFTPRDFVRDWLRESCQRNIFSSFVLLAMSDLRFELWPHF